MKAIAILNLKGGVAKTTTAINTAAILAADYKQRVLLVDADSQCNLTEFFGGDPAKGNLAEVLRRKGEIGAEAYGIQPTNFAGIDLLAGDESLMDLDLTKVETGGVAASVLRELCQWVKKAGLYDWVIIDCPPAFNAASCAALLAADEVVIPIKLDAFSLRGIANLSRQIENMRKVNPVLKLGGLLPTMWYRSDNITGAETALRSSGLPIYPHIRKAPKVDDMTFAQQPLLTSSPKSAAGKDYRVFVAQLMGGVSNGL